MENFTELGILIYIWPVCDGMDRVRLCAALLGLEPIEKDILEGLEMADDKNPNKHNINEKDFDEYYFKVWKNYEDVAMHFNDLIIRVRIQSIGGIAALAAILGIFLTDTTVNDDVAFKYGLASIVLLFLILFWLAIWVLDLQYYNRLLEGAVNAILLLEKNKEDFLKDKKINLSTNIENAFKQRFEHEPKGWVKRIFNGRNGFYLIVFTILLLGFAIALGMYIKSTRVKVPDKTGLSSVKVGACLSGGPAEEWGLRLGDGAP